MRKIILASSSPRRKELLTTIGLKFKVVKTDIKEKLNPRLKSFNQAEAIANQKLLAVQNKFSDEIIIAADTMVIHDGKTFGKPEDLKEARRMIEKLQGKWHIVVTGYVILDCLSGKKITNSVKTEIFMRKLSQDEIKRYVARATALDKAGGYAIQGIGSTIIEKIKGSYSSAVGLPLFEVARDLKKFGIVVF